MITRPLLPNNIRYAVRTLLKSPAFTAVAVVTLALGIGANTAIFSLINAVLLRALPYHEPERLVEICEKIPQYDGIPVAYPDYLDWRAGTDAFENMAISGSYAETMTGRGPAEKVTVAYISHDFLPVLGVRPFIGRGILESDDRPEAPRVTVLSHSFWQERFGGQQSALGQTLTLASEKYEIVGVLPPSFRYHRGGDVYVPFEFALKTHSMIRGNHDNTFVIARLKNGVTVKTAAAQIATVAQRLEHEYPMNSGVTTRMTPLRELLSGGARHNFMVLLGAVGLVLLIACVNVANLLLARAAGRRKEIAIRTAVGASRARIAGQLLTESVLLAVAGGAVGILLAQAAFRILSTLLPWGFDRADLRIDPVVLAFTFGVSCLAGIAFGLIPAFRAANVSLSDAMKDGGRGASGVHGGARLRSALVISEVAMAVVLLAGAGLLMRSLYSLLAVDLGYRTDHLLTMRVSWPYPAITTLGRAAEFMGTVTERVNTLPGVRAAGGVSWLGMANDGHSSAAFYRLDQPVPAQGHVPDAEYQSASPGFFQALGIPLLRGRMFNKADGVVPDVDDPSKLGDAFNGRPLAIVINQSMAKKFWPDVDPIGRTFHFGPPGFNGPAAQVIGIVGDYRQNGLTTPPRPQFYVSLYQFPNDVTLVIRTHSDPVALTAAVRKTIADIDPNVPITAVRTMERIVSDSVSSQRMNMALLAVFAGVAFLLAAVGLYGLLAYGVAQRTHEIGIRMALGAAPGELRMRVLREACTLTSIGIVIGLGAGLALTRVLASMLYGVEPTDPMTFTAVAVTLFAVSIAAGYIPARRATRVDPLVALRCE